MFGIRSAIKAFFASKLKQSLDLIDFNLFGPVDFSEEAYFRPSPSASTKRYSLDTPRQHTPKVEEGVNSIAKAASRKDVRRHISVPSHIPVPDFTCCGGISTCTSTGFVEMAQFDKHNAFLQQSNGITWTGQDGSRAGAYYGLDNASGREENLRPGDVEPDKTRMSNKGVELEHTDDSDELSDFEVLDMGSRIAAKFAGQVRNEDGNNVSTLTHLGHGEVDDDWLSASGSQSATSSNNASEPYFPPTMRGALPMQTNVDDQAISGERSTHVQTLGGHPTRLNEEDDDDGWQTQSDEGAGTGSNNRIQPRAESTSPQSLLLVAGSKGQARIEGASKPSFIRTADRFVKVRDNGEEFCGLVMSEWTIDAMNRALKLAHAARRLGRAVEDAQGEVDMFQAKVEGMRRCLASKAYEPNDESADHLRRHLAESEALLEAARTDHRTLAFTWDRARADSEQAHAAMFRYLEPAMERVGLKRPLEDVSPASSQDNEGSSAAAGPFKRCRMDDQRSQRSEPSERDSDGYLSLDALHRATVWHEMHDLPPRLTEAREAFDRRSEIYWESHSAFERDIQAGGNNTGWTWDDWHAWRVVETGKLGRTLDDLETRWAGTRHEAKRLGLWDMARDRGSSGFFDQEGSCGYDSEFERELMREAPVRRVQAWIAGMQMLDAIKYQTDLDSLPAEEKERVRARDARKVEVDDWDVSSLGCGESVDDLEISSRRRKIDGWRETCLSRAMH